MEIFKSQDSVLKSFDKSEIDEYEDVLKRNICSPIGSLQDCWILYYCRDLDDFLYSIAREVGGYCAESLHKSAYRYMFKGPGIYGFHTTETYKDDELGRYITYKTLDELKKMCITKLNYIQEDMEKLDKLSGWCK